MVHNGVRKGVVRVQGDKLCLLLGLSPGTKIPKESMYELMKANYGDVVTVCNKDVEVTAAIKALAEILEGKNVLED